MPNRLLSGGRNLGAWLARVAPLIAQASRLPPYPVSAFGRQTVAAASCHPFTVNLAVFFTLSLIVFRRNAEFLFYGGDGTFEASLIEQFPAFAPPLIGFTSDILRGLGNVVFTVNPYWIPAYFLPLSWQGAYTNFALTYAICATEIFTAIYLTARMVQLPQLVGIAGGWLAPLIVMPYFGFGLIPHSSAAFPHYGTVQAVAMLLAASCLAANVRSWAGAVTAGAVLTLGIGFIAIVAPTLLLLALPIVGMCAFLSCIGAPGRREALLRLLTYGSVVALCLAVFGAFVAGLFLGSTASFFKSLSIRPATVQDISVAFWQPYPLFGGYKLFIVGGLIGAALLAWAGRGPARLMGAGVLLTEATFFAIGGLQLIRPFWFGPALWYFEGFIFFYLALCSAAGAYIALRLPTVLVASLIRRLASRLPAPQLVPSTVAGTFVGIAFAGLASGYVLDRGTTGSAGPYIIPYPQAETAIGRILKDEISLKSERRFRGRVADFFGRSVPEVTDFQVWNMLRHFALQQEGSMYHGASFWQDAVPILAEYNPLMTPAHFVFMRRFFSLAGDYQTRNRVEMRRIDSRLLAMAGVRFVVTDAPYDDGTTLRKETAVAIDEKYRKEIQAPKELKEFSVHLYELADVNLGQYSPTEAVRIDAAADILKALASPNFQPKRSVIASDPIAGTLIPARLEEFSIGRGEVRVRATSAGRSILLLPIEFSNCLVLKGVPSEARLFRANLVLTGVSFDRAVDLRIAYFTGPFSNSTCRLRDRTDFQRLKISDAFRDNPEFNP